MDSKGNNRAHWNLYTWSSKPNLSTKNFKRGKTEQQYFMVHFFATFFLLCLILAFNSTYFPMSINLESIFHHLCLN
jgi:hypothetical protein